MDGLAEKGEGAPSLRDETIANTQRAVNEYFKGGVSTERKQVMARDLVQTVTILSECKRSDGTPVPFYLAGGGAADLLANNGEFKRDHLDMDFSAFREDIGDLRKGLLQHNFGDMVKHDGTPISLTDIEQKKCDRVFFFDQSGKQDAVEMILLDRNADGTVVLTNEVGVDHAVYESSKIAVEGKDGTIEIPVTPIEVVAWHKLQEGRLKDFNDVKKCWEAMNAQQRTRLGDLYLASKSFVEIEGQRVNNIGEIIRLMSPKADALTFSLSHEAKNKAGEKFNQYDGMLTTVFDLYQKSESVEQFTGLLDTSFQGVSKERLSQIVSLLYHTPRVVNVGDFKKSAADEFKLVDGITDSVVGELSATLLYDTKYF